MRKIVIALAIAAVVAAWAPATQALSGMLGAKPACDTIYAQLSQKRAELSRLNEVTDPTGTKRRQAAEEIAGFAGQLHGCLKDG